MIEIDDGSKFYIDIRDGYMFVQFYMEVEEANVPNTFHFPSDVNLFLGSARRKANTNLAVIGLVRGIDDDDNFVATDEQGLISHYVG